MSLIGYSLLLMITFAAFGSFIGTMVRRRQAVIPLSIGLTIPVFFISGPFGPAIWGDQVIVTMTQLQPVYYGIAIFQHAFHNFTTTSTGPTIDGVILVGFAVLMVIASTIALGREQKQGNNKLMNIYNSLIPIFAIVLKDISVWLRQPTAIAATILPAIAFMVILYFGAQAVGRNPSGHSCTG